MRYPSKWKKNIRKQRRASGLEYTSTSGKTVREKRFKFIDCHCPLKYSTKITVEQQQAVHDNFYQSRA